LIRVCLSLPTSCKLLRVDVISIYSAYLVKIGDFPEFDHASERESRFFLDHYNMGFQKMKPTNYT